MTIDQPLPIESVYMGDQIAEYTGRKRRLFTGSMLLLLGVTVAGAGFAVTEERGLYILIGTGLGVFLLGAYLVIAVFLDWDWTIRVYEKGMIITRRAEHSFFYWQDMASITQQTRTYWHWGMKMSRNNHYILHLIDGRRFVFDDKLKHIENLGLTLQHRSVQVIFPRMAERYNQGGLLDFGPLTVSQAGISNGMKTLPWTEIKQIIIRDGMIRVHKQGRLLVWASVPVETVPNVFVFLALVDQIVGVDQE